MPRGPILLLVPDLFFQARLEAAARRAGFAVARAREWRGAVESAGRERPSAVIVDLGASAAAGPLDLLRALRADAGLASVPTLGFLSHVRADLAAAARDAGCGTVIAKSALSDDTPGVLRRLVPGAAPAGRSEEE